MKRFLWLTMLIAPLVLFVVGCDSTGVTENNNNNNGPQTSRFTIVSPYRDVNWATWGRYKTATHVHTNRSDGGPTLAEMVEAHYARGFHILSITDHNEVNRSWTDPWIPPPQRTPPESNSYWGNNATSGHLTMERYIAITTGANRPDGRGMLRIPYTNEQSRGSANHVNTYFLNWNASSGMTLEYIVAHTDREGGISRINHPGRATGNNAFHASWLERHVNMFLNYPSVVGFEIVNRHERYPNDRIYWDNVLMQTMPHGRFVWGFADDDSHQIGQIGNAWNVFVMPENNLENFRSTMMNGNFYAVARNAGHELGTGFSYSGNAPSINSIVVNDQEATITITASYAAMVTWISNGNPVHWGTTIRLYEIQEDRLGSYVRANITGPGGIAFTQPFGIIIDAGNAVLGTPERLRWDGNIARWNAVRNAESYLVQLYQDGTAAGTPQSTDNTHFDFSGIFAQGNTGTGLFTFTVRAIAANAEQNSPVSEPSAANFFISLNISTSGRDEFADTHAPVGGIAHGDGIFVAVGGSGTVMTSPDGITWTRRTLAADIPMRTQDLQDVTWGAGRFVAVGINSLLIHSADGITWEAAAVNPFATIPRNLNAVAFNGERFMLAGSMGAAAWSNDGQTWTRMDIVTGNPAAQREFRSITWGDGRFFAAGDGGTMVRTNAAGTAWEQVSTSILNTANNTNNGRRVNAIAVGNNLMIAVGAERRMSWVDTTGLTGAHNNWNLITNDVFGSGAVQIMDIIFANEMFVAAANNGRIATSANGVDWTAIPEGTETGTTKFFNAEITAAAYGNGTFVFGGRANTGVSPRRNIFTYSN